MTHAHAIRLLTSLADMLDNLRALSGGQPATLLLCYDFTLSYAEACNHAAEWLATLPEVVEEPGTP